MKMWKPKKSIKINKNDKIEFKAVEINGLSKTNSRQTEEQRKEIMLSIYRWDNDIQLNSIPVGYNKDEVVTIDATVGSVLFINDFFRKNINGLISGLVRCDGLMLIGVNDRSNVLNVWDKHFSNISSKPEDNTALIQNIYFTLQDRIENVIPNDIDIYMFVNNISVFDGDNLEMINSIVSKGGEYGIHIIATTDIIDANNVKGNIPGFDTVILCDFSKSIIEGESKEFIPYEISPREMELVDIQGVYVNPDYLNTNQFLIYNSINELATNGVIISPAVTEILTSPYNLFNKIQDLTIDEVKEFLELLSNSNNKSLIVNFGRTIDSIGELAIGLSQMLKNDKPKKMGYINVDIPAIQDVITGNNGNSMNGKVYSDEEIDNIFIETLKSGAWKDIAKLDDEQEKLTENIMGVKKQDNNIKEIIKEDTVIELPKKDEPVENNGVTTVEPVTEKVPVKKVPIKKTPTVDNNIEDKREKEIQLFMTTTGLSREEAENMLKE